MPAPSHTPGPWLVAGPGDGFQSDELCIDARGDDSLHVAMVWPMGDGDTTAEQEANARLIAAAPDLLASLRELHDWMRDHAKVVESLDILTRSHAILEKATSTAKDA